MYFTSYREPVIAGIYSQDHVPANNNEVSCNWQALREQLLRQWDRISPYELDSTDHNRLKIASLIQHKYGISNEMAINYLRNFERTLPLLGCA